MFQFMKNELKRYDQEVSFFLNNIPVSAYQSARSFHLVSDDLNSYVIIKSVVITLRKWNRSYTSIIVATHSVKRYPIRLMLWGFNKAKRIKTIKRFV